VNLLSKVRILLADDHPVVREVVRDALEPTFEIVGTADNGRSLTEAAFRLKPDVIITDISMPILNGIEAVKQIRESGSRAKIIFLTVHSDPEFVRVCVSAGAVGYVVKQELETNLLFAVREALAGRTYLSPNAERKH
jgi:DNA-binding NarL/FixJ family response regulator